MPGSVSDEFLERRAKALHRRLAIGQLAERGLEATANRLKRSLRWSTVSVVETTVNGKAIRIITTNDPTFYRLLKQTPHKLLLPGEVLGSQPTLVYGPKEPNERPPRQRIHAEQLGVNDAVQIGGDSGRVASSNRGCKRQCVALLKEIFPTFRHVNPANMEPDAKGVTDPAGAESRATGDSGVKQRRVGDKTDARPRAAPDASRPSGPLGGRKATPKLPTGRVTPPKGRGGGRRGGGYALDIALLIPEVNDALERLNEFLFGTPEPEWTQDDVDKRMNALWPEIQRQVEAQSEAILERARLGPVYAHVDLTVRFVPVMSPFEPKTDLQVKLQRVTITREHRETRTWAYDQGRVKAASISLCLPINVDYFYDRLRKAGITGGWWEYQAEGVFAEFFITDSGRVKVEGGRVGYLNRERLGTYRIGRVTWDPVKLRLAFTSSEDRVSFEHDLVVVGPHRMKGIVKTKHPDYPVADASVVWRRRERGFSGLFDPRPLSSVPTSR
jgi:hypothetical protein